MALGGLVMHSEVQFAAVAFKFLEEEKLQKGLSPVGVTVTAGPGTCFMIVTIEGDCQRWLDKST